MELSDRIRHGEHRVELVTWLDDNRRALHSRLTLREHLIYEFTSRLPDRELPTLTLSVLASDQQRRIREALANGEMEQRLQAVLRPTVPLLDALAVIPLPDDAISDLPASWADEIDRSAG